MAPADAAANKGIHLDEVGGDVQLEAGGDIIGGDRVAGDQVAGDKIVNITTVAAAEAVTQRPLVSRSPYRGLEHFIDQDRALFFGRDSLIASLLAKVEASPLVLALS